MKNFKTRIGLTIVLIILNLFLYPQNQKKIDSLEIALTKVSADTFKITLLNELAVEYMNVSSDVSDSLLSKAKLIAENINNYNYIKRNKISDKLFV